MTTLQKGSKGNEVKLLQLYLKISADGIFGKQTEASVKTFQSKHNLEVTGIVAAADWAAIGKEMPLIKKGSRNYFVKIWQLILGISADGIFGNGTYNSTRAYQAASGLEVDGEVGQQTWGKAFGFTAPNTPTKVTNPQPIDYKQYDSRWASVIYTQNNSYCLTQTIKSSGCGPTSAADIVATWWDKNITPKELAALSVANGYRTKNSGTDWGFFLFIAKKFGASKFIQTTSIETTKNALMEGAYAVVSFRPSKWTSGGHFCCLWKWDGKYFYVNDPASAAASRAKGTYQEVKDAAKQFFIFYK